MRTWLSAVCSHVRTQEEARIRGLKVIVVFADNWYPTGGVMNYVQWVKGDSGTRYDFFTDGTRTSHARGVVVCLNADGQRNLERGPEGGAAEVKRLYKRNILAMLNRRNTKNGRLYKEDPTIMCVLHHSSSQSAHAHLWLANLYESDWSVGIIAARVDRAWNLANEARCEDCDAWVRRIKARPGLDTHGREATLSFTSLSG